MNARLSPARLFLATSVVITSLLAGCSRPAAPTEGSYRAVLTLRGGELPLPLTVVRQGEQITLQVPTSHEGTASVTSLSTRLSEGKLQAELPEAAGALSLSVSRAALQGELRFTDPKGQAVTLPVTAELTGGDSGMWRFVKEPSTDNADISGRWQLEAVNPDHFNVPVSVQLVQRFDQVDGVLTTPEGQQLAVLGQVHGDEVYLSTLGHGRAVLLKGKVTPSGELQGEAWVNLGTAHPWVARRQVDSPPATEPMQPVVLPWSVPLVPQAMHQ